MGDPVAAPVTQLLVTRARSSPAIVATVALLSYVAILLLFWNWGGDVRDFILIGKTFITKSDRSEIIRVDPTYDYLEETNGYDGEFVYFIALDPENARYYVD